VFSAGLLGISRALAGSSKEGLDRRDLARSFGGKTAADLHGVVGLDRLSRCWLLARGKVRPFASSPRIINRRDLGLAVGREARFGMFSPECRRRRQIDMGVDGRAHVLRIDRAEEAGLVGQVRHRGRSGPTSAPDDVDELRPCIRRGRSSRLVLAFDVLTPRESRSCHSNMPG